MSLRSSRRGAGQRIGGAGLEVEEVEVRGVDARRRAVSPLRTPVAPSSRATTGTTCSAASRSSAWTAEASMSRATSTTSSVSTGLPGNVGVHEPLEAERLDEPHVAAQRHAAVAARAERRGARAGSRARPRARGSAASAGRRRGQRQPLLADDDRRAVAVVDAGAEEVHRGRADERRDEQVGGPVVQLLRLARPAAARPCA